ncbi:MAG: hypothetical protein U0326_06450 [Polyangiales bacterium]
MQGLGEHPIPDDEYDIRETVERLINHLHALALPDEIVRLAETRLTGEGNITLPGDRSFPMTAWARGQLARLAGVTDDEMVADTEKVNARLANLSGEIKVRARRDPANKERTLVRACLDPAVSPRATRPSWRALVRALGDEEWRFRDATFSDTGFFCTVLGDENWSAWGTDFRGGFHLFASEVGAGIALDDCWLRREDCECRLLMAPGGERLLVLDGGHDLTEDALTSTITNALQALPARQDISFEWVRASMRVEQLRAAEAVRGMLDRRDIPEAQRRHALRAVETARASLGRELPRWATGQLIADIGYRAPPDVRFTMERLAGDYIAKTIVATS